MTDVLIEACSTLTDGERGAAYKSCRSSSFSLFSMCHVVILLLVGRQEGHPACKNLGVGWLVVTISLELCTTYSSSCRHHAPPSSLVPTKIHNGDIL